MYSSVSVEASLSRLFAVIDSTTIVVAEVVNRFGFQVIGRTEECQQQFYAITPERKVTHPAVTAITSDTRARLFPKRRKAGA